MARTSTGHLAGDQLLQARRAAGIYPRDRDRVTEPPERQEQGQPAAEQEQPRLARPTFQPIAAIIERAAQGPAPQTAKPSREHARHGKVWEQDLKTIAPKNRVESSDFYEELAAQERLRTTGDPRRPVTHRVAQILAGHETRQRTGYTRATYGQLARRAGCCRDTARRCIRWLESHGKLDTLNVIARDTQRGTRRIVRQANLYMLRVAQRLKAQEPRPTEPLTGTVAEALARLAATLGLDATRIGLKQPAPT